MNTTTPYEKLIAEKLDQVTVPDMADSVWASIGMQLDAGDMPDQGDNGPDRGSAPGQGSAPGMGWYGFFGVVMVAATLWWYYNHKVAPVVKMPVPVAAPAPVVVPGPVADSSTFVNSIKRRNILPAPAGIRKDTVQLDNVPENIIRPDSVLQLPQDWIPVPFFDSLSVKPRGRKPRGVKGITSDDYKISTEKGHH